MRGRGVERGKAGRDQGTSDLTKAPAGRARGREPAAATWSRACGRVGIPHGDRSEHFDAGTERGTLETRRNRLRLPPGRAGSCVRAGPPCSEGGWKRKKLEPRNLGSGLVCAGPPPRVLSGVSPEMRAAGRGLLSPKYHAEKAWVHMASWFLTIHYVTPRL